MVKISAKEPYDYISSVTPDYDYTLTIKAQGSVTERGMFNQILHTADDGSDEVVTLATTPIFYFVWKWNQLSESNAGTILDLYFDPLKAKGMARSFKLTGHDGNSYVVKFANNDLARTGNASSRWGYPDIKFKVIGKV